VVSLPAGTHTLEAEVALRPGAPGAVVCHPHPAFGGRLDNPLVISLAEALHDAGLSTVRFNFRGLGASTGEATGGLEEHLDVRAAAAYLRAAGAPEVALVGYSFGALMAMKAIAQGERAAAMVAVGFPSTIIGQHPDRLADVERALESGVPWLFIQGDRDHFCPLDRVRAWAAGRPSVHLDVRTGQGHFFSGVAAADLVARVTAFVAHAVG
jgi:alpha/beta superfamily hydrolase